MNDDSQKILIDALRKQVPGLTPETAQRFVDAFVKVVSESLALGEPVRIIHLGLFRALGQNMLFVPERVLLEKANESCAGFEPMELPPDVTPEMLVALGVDPSALGNESPSVEAPSAASIPQQSEKGVNQVCEPDNPNAEQITDYEEDLLPELDSSLLEVAAGFIEIDSLSTASVIEDDPFLSMLQSKESIEEEVPEDVTEPLFLKNIEELEQESPLMPWQVNGTAPSAPQPQQPQPPTPQPKPWEQPAPQPQQPQPLTPQPKPWEQPAPQPQQPQPPAPQPKPWEQPAPQPQQPQPPTPQPKPWEQPAPQPKPWEQPAPQPQQPQPPTPQPQPWEQPAPQPQQPQPPTPQPRPWEQEEDKSSAHSTVIDTPRPWEMQHDEPIVEDDADRRRHERFGGNCSDEKWTSKSKKRGGTTKYIIIGILIIIGVLAAIFYNDIFHIISSKDSAAPADTLKVAKTEPVAPVQQTVDTTTVDPSVNEADPEAPARNILPGGETLPEDGDGVLMQPGRTTNEYVYDVITREHLLTHMARQYYGHKAFWVYIYFDNTDKIDNPNYIKEGTRLRIPPRERYDVSQDPEVNLRNAQKMAAEVLSRFN